MTANTTLALDPEQGFYLSEHLSALMGKAVIAPVRASWFAAFDNDRLKTPDQVVEALVEDIRAWAKRLHCAIYQITITVGAPTERGPGAIADVLAVQMDRREDAAVEVGRLLEQGRRGRAQIRIVPYVPQRHP